METKANYVLIGAFTLITWLEREQKMDVDVAWASHILWIKPT